MNFQYGKSTQCAAYNAANTFLEESCCRKVVPVSSSVNNLYRQSHEELITFLNSGGISSIGTICIKKSRNYFLDFIINMIFINYFLNPMKSPGLWCILCPTASMRMRETHIAVKSDNTIPSPSINPNHLIREIPKI